MSNNSSDVESVPRPPPKPPSRSWTTMSNDTTTSEAERNAQAGAMPAFIAIFQEAAKYGDILTEEPELSSDSETSSINLPDSSESTSDTADTGATTPTTAVPLGGSVGEEKRIDELLNRLIVDDKLKISNSISRIGQIGANAYTAPERSLDGMGGDNIVEPHPVTGEDSPEELKALNERIIPLLVQEFGDITEADEEEHLIVESDGAYFQDVAILGIIHLTTHRVTFHASLLSTRPDMQGSHILKSGPVIIHRPGWRRKKRVWLELSHDMICSFPGSTDEERVRPIRSIMLSDITDIKPLDHAEPKAIRFNFKTASGMCRGFVEVDTIESAADWRRAFGGALHNFRRHRSKLFRGEDDSETGQSGVRIAVPLHRVERFDSRSWGTFAHVVTLFMTGDKVSEPGQQGYTEGTEDIYDTLSHWSEQKNASASDLSQRSLTITVIQGFNAKRLADAIADAKKRRIDHPASSDEGDQIVVDFGELAMIEPAEEGGAGDGVRTKDVESHLRRMFALPKEDEVWHFRSAMGIFNTAAGYLLIHARYICFWAKGLVSDNKLRFYAHDVNSAFIQADQRACSKRFHRMVLQVKGHKDMTFSFKSNEIRDQAIDRINAVVKVAKELHTAAGSKRLSVPPTPSPADSLIAASQLTVSPLPTPSIPTTPSGTLSPAAELASTERIQQRASTRVIPASLLPHIPKAINLPEGGHLRITPQHFACLTIGSRGDVQPYIALCLGLKKEGHQVTIVTHEEYKAWVEAFGINHRTAGGDPGALMKLSVEHKMFSPAFFKESLGGFRKWLDDLLVDSYEQVKASGATVLIESPSAMAGVHIAEALKIPYFRAFTMPWSRTAEYPHAFISPPDFVAGSFNYSTYVLFDNVFWKATSLQINPWRKKHLGLPSTDLEHLAQTKIPFLYNFSPHVVPKPLDWSDTTIITGYWFLDNPDVGWKAPQTLLDFIAKARADGKPLVYIGFGSIVVENPKAMTRSIVKAVLKSDVRAILNKGWSARMASTDPTPEVEIPHEVYELDKVPHDWLFPQIDAALHHGGAGTTGASLRAGLPTLIKPWFGDQFFWAARVQKLGAGLRVPSLSSTDLAHALTKATTDRVIREKAQAVGEKIRQEDGVGTAISSLYTYLHRAGMRMPHHHTHERHHSKRKSTTNAGELAAMVDQLPHWNEEDATAVAAPPALPHAATIA